MSACCVSPTSIPQDHHSLWFRSGQQTEHVLLMYCVRTLTQEPKQEEDQPKVLQAA